MLDLAPRNPYSLSVRSPVLIAAGCLGYGLEATRAIPLTYAGAFVTRTTTLHARKVAVPPKLVEIPAGLLLQGDWPNPGIRTVLERYAPAWATWEIPVLLSIAAADPGEFAQIAGLLEGVEGIAGLQMELAEQTERIGACVAAARRATQLPILAHLPVRDPAPLAAFARAALAGGADALVVGGPFPGPLVASEHAPNGPGVPTWICGPATHYQALRLVAEVAAAVDAPVIGVGGVTDSAGVARMQAAGAEAVQIGSVLLSDPWGMKNQEQ